MTASRAEIENVLARHFNRRFCILTNRGTTALTAALHALDRPASTRALFPAVMCSIPVFAARFAGWTPVFADVNLKDANFDLEAVERVLGEGGVGAVIPVQMFGKPDDMEGLAALCLRYKADLVEDVALSMGAAFHGHQMCIRDRANCGALWAGCLPWPRITQN